NGLMILLPSAAGTVNCPPFITVPVGAVVIEVTWQMLQPTELNNAAPVCASAVAARAVSRDGAFVALINLAKWSMSSNPSGPKGSSGSGTVSQIGVTSVGFRRLV